MGAYDYTVAQHGLQCIYHVLENEGGLRRLGEPLARAILIVSVIHKSQDDSMYVDCEMLMIQPFNEARLGIKVMCLPWY